jgi:large subunit ribosomal protein L24
MKIITSDTVLVTAGKDKGKTGKVVRAFPKLGKVVVEKVNVITKHIKKSVHGAGQKIQFEKPIDASNVKPICPKCSKPTRIGYNVLKTGKKVRVCKQCGEGISNPKTSAK